MRPALLLLAGGVFCLLLIACANVSNLLLVRGDAQLKELTIRRALGASPGRLRRQLAFEGLVLTAAGAMAGLPLALALVAVPRAFDIPTLRSVQASQLDWSMVLTAVVAAAVTTIVFSVVPLAGVGDTRAAAVLRAASAATTAAPSRTRLRRVLVLAQVALAMLLLLMAGLMLKSLDGLRRIELGFDANQLLTARVSLPQCKDATPQQAAAFYQALADEAGRLPGVAAAGIVRLLPLATTIGDWGLDIDGFDEGTAQTAKGDWQVATSGAFAAMGTKLLEGRTFERTDRGDTANGGCRQPHHGPSVLAIGGPRTRWADSPGFEPIPAVDPRRRDRGRRAPQRHHRRHQGEVLHSAGPVGPRHERQRGSRRVCGAAHHRRSDVAGEAAD